MSYFNPRLKIEVIVDISPVGLGGLLVQDSKVITYTSRAQWTPFNGVELKNFAEHLGSHHGKSRLFSQRLNQRQMAEQSVS